MKSSDHILPTVFTPRLTSHTQPVFRWRLSLLAALFWLGLFSGEAATVNFTTAEGYTDGTLSGQANWYVGSTAADEFTVDTSHSRLVLSGPDVWQVASYTTIMNPTQAATSIMKTSVNFSFTQDGALTTTQAILGAGLGVSPGVSTGIYAQFRRVADGNYSLAIQSSAGTNPNWFSYNTISAASLGISGMDVTSDLLSLSISVNRDAATTSWIVSTSIRNETTQTEVYSTSVTWASTNSSIYADSSWYSYLYEGQIATANVSDVSVYSFSSSSVPEPESFALSMGGILLLLMTQRIRRKQA